MNTYEIFTSKYSKIIQADNVIECILKLIESVDIKDIIAIIDVDRGAGFIND